MFSSEYLDRQSFAMALRRATHCERLAAISTIAAARLLTSPARKNRQFRPFLAASISGECGSESAINIGTPNHKL